MKARQINNQTEIYNGSKTSIVGLNGKIINGWNYTKETDAIVDEQGFVTVIEKPLTDSQQYGAIECIDSIPYFSIVEKPIIPPMPIMFDMSKFKVDLKQKLNIRMRVLYPMYAVIVDNLKQIMEAEHYATIKMFMTWWLEDEAITQADYDIFVECFTIQGIDIINK